MIEPDASHPVPRIATGAASIALTWAGCRAPWVCRALGRLGVLLTYDRFLCSPMSASNAYVCCGSGDRPRSKSPVRWGSGPRRQTAWSARRPSWRRPKRPGLALAGCWISPSWSTGLTVGDHPGWALHEDPAAGTDGLAAVLVARRHRHGKVSVCGYLADVYCLGVKNALGPEVMDDLGLRGFVRDFFSGYDGDPRCFICPEVVTLCPEHELCLQPPGDLRDHAVRSAADGSCSVQPLVTRGPDACPCGRVRLIPASGSHRWCVPADDITPPGPGGSGHDGDG
jgi:hypothetical protein